MTQQVFVLWFHLTFFFSGRLRQCFLKLRPDSEPGQCDFKARYRTISGRCNNLQNPEWGSAGQTYRRLIANAYQDGKSVPRGGRHPSSLPNPRWISQKNHPDADHPDYRFTHMVMQFGQFLDHDVTLTPKDGNHYLLNVNLYNIIYLCQKKEEILSISCNLTICSFFAWMRFLYLIFHLRNISCFSVKWLRIFTGVYWVQNVNLNKNIWRETGKTTKKIWLKKFVKIRRFCAFSINSQHFTRKTVKTYLTKESETTALFFILYVNSFCRGNGLLCFRTPRFRLLFDFHTQSGSLLLMDQFNCTMLELSSVPTGVPECHQRTVQRNHSIYWCQYGLWIRTRTVCRD